MKALNTSRAGVTSSLAMTTSLAAKNPLSGKPLGIHPKRIQATQ
jgi:hypothetical protein